MGRLAMLEAPLSGSVRRQVLAGVTTVILVATSALLGADNYPGFPVAVPSATNGDISRLVVSDFGGGPEKEILCIRGNTLIMVDAAGAALPGFPLVLGPGLGFRDVFLGDVTTSYPGKEIVVTYSGIEDRILILGPSGTPVLPDILEGDENWWNPTFFLADLDGDGDQEVLALDSITVNGVGRIYAYHGDGASVTGFPLVIPFLQFDSDPGYSAAADLDFDGRSEIAFTDNLHASGGDDVPFVVVRSDGTLLPGFPYETLGGNTVGMPAFADLDGASNWKSEIVGSGLFSLIGLRFDGSIHWPMEFTPGCTFAEPIIGNFDLDPNLEVAISDFDLLQVFDPDTGYIVGTWNEGYYLNESMHPTAGDIDGDGIDELVMIAYLQGSPADAKLHVIDPLTMSNEPGWPHSFGPLNGEAPYHATLEDLDLDGDLEIITILGNMIHVLDPPNLGAPVYDASWPTYRANYARNRDYHYDKPPYPHFTRGDANRDDQIDLGDVIRIGQILFFGHPTKCPLAIDVNDDSSGNIADMVSLVSYLFLGGAEPVAPFPDCEPLPRTPECMIFACP